MWKYPEILFASISIIVKNKYAWKFKHNDSNI